MYGDKKHSSVAEAIVSARRCMGERECAAVDRYNYMCRVRDCNRGSAWLRSTHFANHCYGPMFWDIIHRVALSGRFLLLEESMREVTSMIDSFMDLFPCHVCRAAYTRYVETRGPESDHLCTFSSGQLVAYSSGRGVYTTSPTPSWERSTSRTKRLLRGTCRWSTADSLPHPILILQKQTS